MILDAAAALAAELGPRPVPFDHTRPFAEVFNISDHVCASFDWGRREVGICYQHYY
jgi:hypothetical protein